MTSKRKANLVFRVAVYFSILLLATAVSLITPASTNAAPGINERINFQGRLLTDEGATVPDGFYNIQFKIYQDGDGQTVGNTTGSPAGSLLWTESHLNNNSQGVTVKNGFLSVQLGSINDFGSAIDWNQDTLWLSMNIGSTNGSCTPFSSCSPDGEMVPMKRMSATPYSLNSALLGGVSSSGFVQLAQGLQTDASTNTSINIDKTGSGDIMALQSGGSDVFVISNNGDINFGANQDRSLSVADAATDSAGRTLTISAGSADTASGSAVDGGNLVLQAGAASATGTSGSVIVQSNGSNRDDAFQINNSSGTNVLSVSTSTGNVSVNSGNILFSTGAGRTVSVQQAVAGVGGSALTVSGGASGSGAGSLFGGNLVLEGGAGSGTGSRGLVVLGTPTFSTTVNDPNCFTGGAVVASSCTIAVSSVDNSSAILVGFSQSGQTATLPDPTQTTAGRLIYISAASGSSEFVVSINGGGTGNSVSMRQNTSVTMLWNGTEWTAAGASSSTTLQAAYDNTLLSAGGAELVVKKTAATNGLTIRDSSTDPVDGTLLSVQTSSAAPLLSVSSNVTEYASNGGAETSGSGGDSTFPASTWGSVGGATVERYTTDRDYIATGRASVSTTTTATANDGVKNTLNATLTANTSYNVSFSTRLASGSFTDMDVYYSVDGTAASATCATGQAINTSVLTKINCTFTTPSSGITSSNGLMIRQAGATVRTFYIDNLSVTIAADYNYATDGSVNDGGSFSTNWTSVSGATVSRSTTVGFNASNSAEAITTGANQGVRNLLSIDPLPDTLYRVTAYAASTTSGFDTFTARYSRDGGTSFVGCADYNTQSVSSSTTNFTKITCYITTDTTATTNPYIYFTQTDATGRTFYIDNFSMTLATSTTPNVQIGGGIAGGPTTLFTLDRGASAPIASDNEALLGSMYYDTTLGKLQCYEADGWGACGSSPNTIVTISPEYTNAVLNGSGVGTMISDICSDTLDINDGTSGQDTICGTNETYNFYQWTSPQASAQTYSIYVTYELPDTFQDFASGQTSIMGRTDSSNSSVDYQVYRNDPSSGLTACGSAVSVSSGSVSSWQTGIASGTADPSTCSFAAGNSIVFKINMSASGNANAYVGNLNFTFNNQ